MRYSRAGTLAVVLAAAALTACSSATRSAAGAGARPAAAPLPPGFKPPAPDSRYPYTQADVHFMTGMIAHHAQAVKMAGWAPSHGASAEVRRLCERIVVAQTDEIELMQTWLRDRREPVPPADAMRMKMKMGDVEHEMLMPGMLSDEEMSALDKARGTEFDRLFILGMIKHHEGAIIMVDELFGSAGAGQDDVVFKFASDVYADQSTEIARMQKMLNSLPGTPR